ncbi:MAG TPA: DUF1501 domain-containing protein, partial [Polyangiaceae bacterium]|nr:DUF1501 domain-containing protein [Polyangiaceae bacterium]
MKEHAMDFTRRRFLLLSGSAAATLTVSLASRSQQACAASIPFVITVQASGAWDPTFLVDPVADNAAFTPFTAAQILTAGQIRYAPFVNAQGVFSQYVVGATPQDFFAKHQSRLLVINGVDNATVSHDVGPRVAFTGSTRDGHPSISGLAAGLQGKEMPLAMFVAGGFASTGGLVPITRGGSLTLLRNLASPNRDLIHPDSVDTLLRAATRARDARLISGTTLPRSSAAFQQILDSRSGALEDRFRQIADELQKATSVRAPNAFADTASGVLALMRSGATAAAHLSTGGFDTHTNHNASHTTAMTRLLQGLDYIIDAATADPALSSRGVVIIVGSDFGRTRYNDAQGKDHWPITSMMAIGVGASSSIIGGARVIGGTTPTGGNGVAALPVKVTADGRTVTAEASDPQGFKLTAAHVQLAL